ncbi:MAG: ABC transporter permease [Hoeflea sp.]|uniref:ABC transporter permease n=1 Tax=Hoeflea sp. TaxID=1940281 RepID=UPI003299127C
MTTAKNNPAAATGSKLGNLLPKLAIPLALIVLWVVISEFKLVKPIFIPPPAAVWKAFLGLAPLLPQAILTTVAITLAGFVIGVSIGTVSGLAMAYSKTVRVYLGAIFDFARPIPVFALIPLFILWFGIGRAPQIALIAMGTSVILGITTIEAIRNVPSIYIRAALTLGADRKRIYTTVIVPYIAPHLIGAIRVAAAASWGLDVAAEFMGSQAGLGYLIILQQTYLRTAGIIILVVIYSILAIFLDTIIAAAEKRLIPWTERRSSMGAVASIVGNT